MLGLKRSFDFCEIPHAVPPAVSGISPLKARTRASPIAPGQLPLRQALLSLPVVSLRWNGARRPLAFDSSPLTYLHLPAPCLI